MRPLGTGVWRARGKQTAVVKPRDAVVGAKAVAGVESGLMCQTNPHTGVQATVLRIADNKRNHEEGANTQPPNSSRLHRQHVQPMNTQ